MSCPAETVYRQSRFRSAFSGKRLWCGWRCSLLVIVAGGRRRGGVSRGRLRCRLQVDCGRSTQPLEVKRSGMDRQASGTSPPVETLPVLLRRVRFHLSDDRLTTAQRPAARLVRLRDLKPPELRMFVTRPPEHPPSLDSEDGRARRCAHQRHGEEPAWSTH